MWHNICYNKDDMIILMGLAGSGKSTQGQKLATATGRVWLSTGELIRESGKYDKIINNGSLIDDEEATLIFAKELAKITREGKQAVVDGYPRNEVQARWLADNLKKALEQVIVIEVSKEESLKRLMKRGRADDTEESIRERFEIAERNMDGVCQTLREKGIKITKIHGEGTEDEVFLRLVKAVEA